MSDRAELQKIIDLDTERFRELGEEIQELKKRIAELEATAAWVDEADSLVRRMSRYILDVLRGDDNSMVGAQIRTATNPILCDARDFMNRTRPPKPSKSEGGADE